MAEKSRTELKAFFETGDRPTQSQFEDLIDSVLNIVNDGFKAWTKLRLSYTDFQPDAGATKTINSIPVPAGYQLGKAFLIPITTFAGGLISAANIQLYDPQDLNVYFNSQCDVYTAIGNYTGICVPGFVNTDRRLQHRTSSSYVRAKLSVTGGTMNSLTSGVIDIY